MGTYLNVDGDTGDVKLPKVRITPEGGVAVLMTCGVVGGVAKGDVVEPAPGINDTFIKAVVNSDFPIGVVYDATIVNGAQGWVVVAGIADVRHDGTTAPTAGWWLGVGGTTPGQAFGLAASPGAGPVHFKEIGHAIRASVGTLIRAIIHFN